MEFDAGTSLQSSVAAPGLYRCPVLPCIHQFFVKIQGFQVTLDTYPEAIQPSPREGKVRLQICRPEIQWMCWRMIQLPESIPLVPFHKLCGIRCNHMRLVNTVQKMYTILQQKLEAMLKYFTAALSIKCMKMNSVSTQGNTL